MYNLKYISDRGKEINFTPLNNFFITSTKGLDQININTAESQGVAQIGSSIQGEAVQPKDIVIEGEIAGRATEHRQLLYDALIPLSNGTLIFNNKFKLYVKPKITPTVQQYPYNCKFQFTLRAPYPYWQALEEEIEDVAGLKARFYFPINYGDTYFEEPLTHMFGERENAAYINKVNTGNVPAPFKVIFIAKVAIANPYILKIETQEYIKIDKSMLAGEVIEIDMRNGGVKVLQTNTGEEIDLINYFDINSTLFELDPGDNLIGYGTIANKNDDVIANHGTANRSGLDCKIIMPPTWNSPYGDDKTYV